MSVLKFCLDFPQNPNGEKERCFGSVYLDCGFFWEYKTSSASEDPWEGKATHSPGLRIGQVQPRLVQDSGYKVRFPRKIFSLVDFKTFFIFTLTSAWEPLSWADKIFILSTVMTEFHKSKGIKLYIIFCGLNLSMLRFIHLKFYLYNYTYEICILEYNEKVNWKCQNVKIAFKDY